MKPELELDIRDHAGQMDHVIGDKDQAEVRSITSAQMHSPAVMVESSDTPAGHVQLKSVSAMQSDGVLALTTSARWASLICNRVREFHRSCCKLSRRAQEVGKTNRQCESVKLYIIFIHGIS